MMEKTIAVIEQSQLAEAAIQLLTSCKNQKKFAFFGKMGAGKTTFIKAICEQLGCEDSATSPTYSIVNEYIGKHRVFHFDLYRLESVDELLNIGFEDYIDQDAYIFIEWPQLAEAFLDDFVKVEISEDENHKRIISIKQ